MLCIRQLTSLQVAPNLVRYGNIEPANFFVQSLNLANEMSQQLSGKPLDVSVKVATNYVSDNPSLTSSFLSGVGELLPNRPHLQGLPHNG